MKNLFLFATFLITCSLTAQTADATLIELNFIGNGNPKNMTKGNNKLFFSATDGRHGRELWVFDIATQLASLVKDIYPNSNSSIDETLFVNINDILYFTADDAFHGKELWRSDGTEAGTYMLSDISLSGGSGIDALVNYNGKVIFSANDGNNGQELWISDGTAAGTVLLKDIYGGANSSNPTDFFVFNNSLYFTATDGTHGRELWKSNGTAAGTVLVVDHNGGVGSLDMGNRFIAFQNRFYFFAYDAVTGYELWKSDGTSAGTQLVKDINIGSANTNYTIFGTATSTYFVFTAFTPTTGYEVWKSDGTAAGTVLLKDINPANANGIAVSNMQYVTYNDKVFFTATDAVNGIELWTTNGTTAGTQLVKDVYPGASTSNITSLTPTANFLIFSARGEAGTNKLWKSNGTAAGTVLVKEVSLSQTTGTEMSFIEMNGGIYFQGGDGGVNGKEVWRTDGTELNTIMVQDVNHGNSSSTSGFSGNRFFTMLGDKAVFVSNDGKHADEPFITDGTIAGTKMIKDVTVGDYAGSIYTGYEYGPSFTKAGNYLFYRGITFGNGYEIYKTDGTPQNTGQVKDIAAGSASSISEYSFFISYNGIFYFRANDQIHGEELWRSDGTEAGTYMLKDINPGAGHGVTSSNIYENSTQVINEKSYAILFGLLYFVANDGTDVSIWRTDGTAAGTVKAVTYPSAGNYDIRPVILNAANGKVFFKTNSTNSTYGNDSLWSTDGTQAGLTFLGVWPITSSQFSRTRVFNNELYFTAYTDNGNALLKTDGTPEGTIVLKEGFANNFSFYEMVSCGSYLYFTVGSPGKQLWRTNGTVGGTIKLDEVAISESQYFLDCTCVSDNLLFCKDLFAHKIWYVNDNVSVPGNFEINVTNANNFLDNEGITDINAFNGNLLLQGSTAETGSEIYYAALPEFLATHSFAQNRGAAVDRIRVYPNPSSGDITLNTLDGSTIENITVYSTLGTLVYDKDTANVDTVSLHLEHYASGMYLLKIKTNVGVTTKKVMLQ